MNVGAILQELAPASMTAKPIDFRLMSQDCESAACSHQYVHLHQIKRYILVGLGCCFSSRNQEDRLTSPLLLSTKPGTLCSNCSHFVTVFTEEIPSYWDIQF